MTRGPNRVAPRWINVEKGRISVTATYEREDGALVATKVGYGATRKEALRDADCQLRPGRWKRLCVSTPSSIFSDLNVRPSSVVGGSRVNAQGAQNQAAAARGEGVFIDVAGRR